MKKAPTLLALAVTGIILLTPATAAAFAPQLPTGQVIEEVTCKSDPQQTYSLFLPSSYTSAKSWPVLYAFDPGGRGKLPVNLFKDVAERLGVIVVGSNNSRNGIEVRGIVEELWTDTHQRFSIDSRRVYTGGFSGGARVAIYLAFLKPGAVAGVIACSGGFPRGISPSSSVPFVFFSTTGTEDFNFPEMQQLKRRLDGAGIGNQLTVFEGGHEWAPPSLCAGALSWMELQAMKAGKRAPDDGLIDELLAQKTREAQMYEAAKKVYEAYLAYEALVMEFKGLRDVSQFATSAAALRNSKEVKESIRNETADEERQASLTTRLVSLLHPDALSADGEIESQFKSVVAELTKQSEQTKDPRNRRVARRVLQSLFIGLYEEVNALYQRKNYAAIPERLERAAAIKPKDARVFYELAAAYSRIGSKNRSLAALSHAIENGFSDADKVEQNEDFAAVRDEAEYKRLLAALKEPRNQVEKK